MASFKDVLGVLGKVAPTIASATLGPLGGSAVTAIEGALGVKSEPNTPIEKRQEAVASAVTQATPEQLAALKQADADYQLKLKELGFQDAEALAKLAADDRDSARKRQISVKDWTPTALAIGITLGFFGILTYMMIKPVPEASRDILNILLGSLGTSFACIIAYYFGSSNGDSEKTQLLARAPAVKE
jgi:hypothetical protein